MSRKVESNSLWSLTVLRDGSQGGSPKLEEAQFRFGRSRGEVKNSRVCTAPSGVIAAIENFGLADQSLEAGVLIEMSTREETGWMEFSSLVTQTKTELMDPSYGPDGPVINNTRSLYTSGTDLCSLEFIAMSNPYAPSGKMPDKIWIRASELPSNRIAWALDNGIFESQPTKQETLHQWFEFENSPHPQRPASFPMPGPLG